MQVRCVLVGAGAELNKDKLRPLTVKDGDRVILAGIPARKLKSTRR